jgi:hypothetical protein
VGHLFAPLFDGRLTAAVPPALADASAHGLGFALLVLTGLLAVGLDAFREPVRPGATVVPAGVFRRRGRRLLSAVALLLGVLAVAATLIRFAASF